MSEYTKLFERAGARHEAPSLSTEGLLRRRDRKRRSQRITAAVVGIAVFLAAVWIVRDVASLNSTQTPAIQPTQTPTIQPTVTGPTETPAETEPVYTGPTYTLGPVTEEDIAVGDAFSQAWLEGYGQAAAAMFSPEGTFEGFQPGVLPALHDWFRAGGWTFGDGGCGIHGYGPQRGVVGCMFTYENDLTRALGMRPVGTEISFVIDSGRIETAWFGGGGDTLHNMFGSPDRDPQDLFRPVWDMFIEWISSRYPNDFARMYDADRGYPIPGYPIPGYPIPGYPILDPASIELWGRYTDEFVASPQELRRRLTEWIASQSFDVQAQRICRVATEEFWGQDLPRRTLEEKAAFYSTLAETEEEELAQVRALPRSEADRATMDAFVPLAELLIDRHRRMAAAAAAGERERLDRMGDFYLRRSMASLISGCLVLGFGL